LDNTLSFFLLIGLLITATVAVIVLQFSNFALGGVFSNMLSEAGSFLTAPLHTVAHDQYMKTTIFVKNTRIVADIAMTQDQETKGLSGRDRLQENQGMLFVFKTPGKYGFWMPSMKFPLDIFWLDSSGSVVYIKENLQPCSSILNCPTYVPDTDSLYVVETVAGFALKNNITKGTQFNFHLPG
jgi:uncharacterized membrane protein (UPF0127 family)